MTDEKNVSNKEIPKVIIKEKNINSNELDSVPKIEQEEIKNENTNIEIINQVKKGDNLTKIISQYGVL